MTSPAPTMTRTDEVTTTEPEVAHDWLQAVYPGYRPEESNSHRGFRFRAGQVRRYSSAGRPEEVVRVSVTQPTGCTFVGPALDILVVTTAVDVLSDVDRVVQPDYGRLFTVHVPDVVDRGTFRYRGPLGSVTRRPPRTATFPALRQGGAALSACLARHRRRGPVPR